MDQASSLRETGVAPQPAEVSAHLPLSNAGPTVVAISSGKGGVGKTSLVANWGVSLAAAGRRVLLVDGDLGLANLQFALGVNPLKSLFDVIRGHATLDETITPTASGVDLLPACSGRFEMANLSDEERLGLTATLHMLSEGYDHILIDTAAGIGANVMALIRAAGSLVVVTTPSRAAQADAYGLLKVANHYANVEQAYVVVNKVRSPRSGETVYGRLAALSDRFLGVGLMYLGHIPRDPTMLRSADDGAPLCLVDPEASCAARIRQLALRLDTCMQQDMQNKSTTTHVTAQRAVGGRS